MISKSTFECFSMEHKDGSYMLRRDRILGVFHMDSNKQPVLNVSLVAERWKELQIRSNLMKSTDDYHLNNMNRINDSIDKYWECLNELKLSSTSSDDGTSRQGSDIEDIDGDIDYAIYSNVGHEKDGDIELKKMSDNQVFNPTKQPKKSSLTLKMEELSKRNSNSSLKSSSMQQASNSKTDSKLSMKHEPESPILI